MKFTFCKRGYFRLGENLAIVSPRCYPRLEFLQFRLICLHTCVKVLFLCGGNFCGTRKIVKNMKFTPTWNFQHLQYTAKYFWLQLSFEMFLTFHSPLKEFSKRLKKPPGEPDSTWELVDQPNDNDSKCDCRRLKSKKVGMVVLIQCKLWKIMYTEKKKKRIFTLNVICIKDAFFV